MNFPFRESKLLNSNFKGTIQAVAFFGKLELDPTVKEKWILTGLDESIKNSILGLPSLPYIFGNIDAVSMPKSEIEFEDI